jgi:hypothetical protein
MRFSVVGEKSAFCSGGVATAEEPSTVRTPSLQPSGRDLSTLVEARIYGEEIARDERFTRPSLAKHLRWLSLTSRAPKLAPNLIW